MNVQPELFGGSSDGREDSLQERRRAREQEAKRSILDQMKAERAEWLERMRSELAAVYRYRVEAWGTGPAYVTADDARALMRAYPDKFALPGGASTNTLGALFLSKDWAPIDTDDQGRSIAVHVSTTPGSRGNHLVRWKFVGAREAKTA